MQPIGATWNIIVRAVAVNVVVSAFTTAEDIVIATPTLALDVPTTPALDSWRGLLLVSWDGNLLGVDGVGQPFSYPAPSYLANVDIFVSVDAGTTYTRAGFLSAGSRTHSIAGLGIGDLVRVQLVAVDRLGQSTAASTYAETTILGISGADILANTIDANTIAAGAIQTNHLSPGFGTDLDISANGSVSLLVGNVATVKSAVATDVANLAALRTRYDFNSTEAVISQPGSAFSVAISNTQLEFREAGTARAYLNAGVFNAPKMSSGEVVLQYHVIQNDTSGTVIKRV